MSGGHFDYKQYELSRMADSIQSLIDKNQEKTDCGCIQDYCEETLQIFEEARLIAKLAEAYINRIDWLVSGDDSEDTFHQRLVQDLAKL